MRMDQTHDPRYRATELAALLARHYPDAAPHMVARVVWDLQAAARAAKRAAEHACNFPLTEEQQDRADKRQARTQAFLERTLADQRLRPASVDAPLLPHVAPAAVELGGDPRGPCARLHIPGQSGDGWGEGFGIY